MAKTDTVEITEYGRQVVEAHDDRVRELEQALRMGVVYIEQMRIVPGGVRDRLRRQWRALLGLPPPER